MRYRTVNDGTLRRAMNKALRALERDPAMVTMTADAGFIIEAGTKDDPGGYQVFVKVSPYRQSLLKNHPDSGGLYEYVLPSKKEIEAHNRARRYGEVIDFLEYQIEWIKNDRASVYKKSGKDMRAQIRKTMREFKEALRVLKTDTTEGAK